jgi:hypothetical protein
MRRNFRSEPYSASASTNAHGIPAARAAAISSRAISGLVANLVASGTAVFARRAASSVQPCGK